MTIDRHIRIIRRTNKKDMHKFYNNYLTTGIVHPAQWFGDAMKWYQIHTFNNPYNIGSPNAELALLLDNRKKIQAYLKKISLVFWGVGKSDTEMELVNFQLEKNGETAYIIALDINYTFLRDFANALKDKTKEVPDRKISFVGIQSLFEEVPSLNSNYTATKRKLHICLGNTLGNYEKTTDIMAVFLKHMNKNDYLLLGFQTNRLLDFIKKRYFGNQYLESLFVSSLPNRFRRARKKEKISWEYNKKKGQVEAWLDGVQIFRSKKFNPYKLKNTLGKSGFLLMHEFKDDFATCLHLYKYLG